MLNIAKGYRDVMRAAERKEWLHDSPGKRELAGSKALLLGYGAIGQLIKPRLEAFDVDVSVVRRTPADGALTPDQWRDQLGAFDWIILAVVIVNIARGAVIDQTALIDALEKKSIGGAFLDVTTPEPLPADNPLWTLENAHISMHLSGRAQDKMFVRSAERFLANLDNYLAGKPVAPTFDPAIGY